MSGRLLMPEDSSDTHSLSCDIIVKDSTTLLESWCEGQCSVDGEFFLQYDNDNQATALGDLGKEAKVTPVWKDLIKRIFIHSRGPDSGRCAPESGVGIHRKVQATNTKQEITKISGQPIIQVIMLSQYEHRQTVGASWTFKIGGQFSLRLDTVNVNWRLIDDKVGGLMNKWKDDEEFIKHLEIISTADSRYWLKELLKHHKGKPTSTTAAPDVVQPSSVAIKNNISVLLIILTLKMLQRSRERSSGATNLPSISLHQMNQDAADTAFH
ncbi:hypothetical protein U0070_011078, partial [Myodes glareolus]